MRVLTISLICLMAISKGVFPQDVVSSQRIGESLSPSAASSIHVLDVSADWLFQWYEEKEKTIPSRLLPNVLVTNIDEVFTDISTDANSVAFLPRSSTDLSATSNIESFPIGLEACSVLISSNAMLISELGQLHVHPNLVKISVSHDIKHIAEVIVRNYNLTDKVEFVFQDAFGVVSSIRNGTSDIGFLSSSSTRMPSVLSNKETDNLSFRLIDLNPAVLSQMNVGNLAINLITENNETEDSSVKGYFSLCDQVDVFIGAVSNQSALAFSVPKNVPLSADAAASEVSRIDSIGEAIMILRELYRGASTSGQY